MAMLFKIFLFYLHFFVTVVYFNEFFGINLEKKFIRELEVELELEVVEDPIGTGTGREVFKKKFWNWNWKGSF